MKDVTFTIGAENSKFSAGTSGEQSTATILQFSPCAWSKSPTVRLDTLGFFKWGRWKYSILLLKFCEILNMCNRFIVRSQKNYLILSLLPTWYKKKKKKKKELSYNSSEKVFKMHAKLSLVNFKMTVTLHFDLFYEWMTNNMVNNF